MILIDVIKIIKAIISRKERQRNGELIINIYNKKYKGYCCHGRTNAYDCPHCLKYN